jgi:hypothetical protein
VAAVAALSAAARAEFAREAEESQRVALGGRGVAFARQTPAESDDDGAATRARAAAALERGLAWLAAQQATQPDGSFPPGHGEQHVPVAVAAIAGLAYMAGGSTPDRGPHADPLSRCVDYLLAHADMTEGSPRYGYISTDGDNVTKMHGHGLATLALAQSATTSPQTARGARTVEVLRAAVSCIEKSQGPEGGWYYDPISSYQHENSVTVCLVQALRGAHGAGVFVEPAVIAKAVDYVKRCQNDDGRFRYALDRDQRSIALTAAGIATLNSIGVYEGPEIARATEALWRELSMRDFGAREEANDSSASVRSAHYERLYLAQALWQSSDRRLFERWFPGEVERMCAAQRADGAWEDGQYGECYATAMNCLVLAIPEGSLPIFQR